MQLTKSLGIGVDDEGVRPRRVSDAQQLAARCERVLIADADANWRDWLSRKFSALGIEPVHAGSVEELGLVARALNPEIVVSELSFADGTWFDALKTIQAAAPLARLVIVTRSGSIASAVEAVKGGVTGYLVKPVTPEHILKAAGSGASGEAAEPVGMSLDRAIWEYLTQTVAACGSIAGAARSLRLDRRSLRRMLSKNPPAR